MNIGIENLIANVGMNFENIIIVVLGLGSIIFFAKDFKIGLVMSFLISGGVFMWFFKAGFNYAPILVIFLVNFIMLSLSLYAISKTAGSGSKYI